MLLIFSLILFHNTLKGDDYRTLVSGDVGTKEVIKPGLYSSFCFELEIDLLELNTIEFSEELKNMDKEIYELIEAKLGTRINELFFDKKLLIFFFFLVLSIKTRGMTILMSWHFPKTLSNVSK